MDGARSVEKEDEETVVLIEESVDSMCSLVDGSTTVSINHR